MTRPRLYRTEGIVLKAYDFAEADRILTLFTPHAGKLRAVAKGVRRTKSRMSGHLDLFTRASLLLAAGRQLDIITQADTVENFRPLRTDLWRLSYGHYVAELVAAFGQEELPNYPLYSLTADTLRRLATAPELGLVVRSFELQLLGLTGFRPQLHECLHCRAVILPESNRFSPKMGGVLCPTCVSSDHAAALISPAALKVLRNLQTNREAMVAVRELEDSVQTEVERHLQEYIAYRLEARPRSLAFLTRIRSEQSAVSR